MPLSIRPAAPHDVPGIVSLLVEDARQRTFLDPLLWKLTANSAARIETAVRAALSASQTSTSELWFVAELLGQIVGVARAMMVPVPPIYDAAAGAPGLLLDDCCTAADAPSGTAETLISATEAALRTAGASRLIASCLATGPLRTLYERNGYAPVTLYLAKHRFGSAALPSGVRPASADDVPGIVKLSARHRQTLSELKPRFWYIHPEADSRFDSWMRRSLTLSDCDMRVAGVAAEIHGYVIARPCAPLLIPIAHDAAPIGIIDDFYDEEFATTSALADNGSSSDNLLTAAESAFAQRGVDSTLVVCPTAWPSKLSLLERRGYQTAKLWMLKN